MDRDRVARVVALVAGLLTLGAGLWAFIGPRSFYDAVATFPPYNRHLIHDIGAFQIGLGATVLLGLRWRDTLLVVLTGYAAGAIVHAVSHIIDRDQGGTDADPFTFTVIAVVTAAAAILRAAGRARER